MDLKGYRRICRMCSVMGLLPLYNFENRTIFYRKLSIFLTLLAILQDLSAATMTRIVFLRKELEQFPALYMYFTKLPNHLSYVMMPFGMHLLCFAANKWNNFFQKLLKVHDSLNFIHYKERPDLIMIVVYHIVEGLMVGLNLNRTFEQESNLLYIISYTCYSLVTEVGNLRLVGYTNLLIFFNHKVFVLKVFSSKISFAYFSINGYLHLVHYSALDCGMVSRLPLLQGCLFPNAPTPL